MQEIITDDDNQLTNENELKKDSETNEEKEEKVENFEKDVKISNSKKYSLNKEEKLRQIKLLQEKINNENSIINEYDNKIEQLKNKEYKPIIKEKKTIEEKENIKKTNKVISKLRLKSKSLNINLSNLAEKQKSIEVGSTYSLQEDNKNKVKLKDIKKEKEIIQNKIKDIDNQIKVIIDNENKVAPSAKYKIKKKYMSNIESKNIINNKISVPINQIKTSPSSFLKSIEELEKKEEEEKELKKLEKYQNLRNRELEIIRRRKNKIDNLTKVNTPKYVQKKNYITAEEKEQKRLMEEEALLQKEIKKRKMKLQPISSQELEKFSKEVQRNEKIFQEELDLKIIQMKNVWQERKNLLPEYKSKFYDYNRQNEEKLKEELFLKKERIKQEVKDRIKFGEEVYRNYQPQLNSKLKTEREKNIKKLENKNKYEDIKELGNKLKKISKKIVMSQPKNFKSTNKFVIDKDKKKDKKLEPLDRYKDYLTEERIKKHMRHLLTPDANSYEKVNKWENMLKSDKNVFNNIEQIKIEAQLLQNKADSKRQLLKEQGTGNINMVDNLNNEISNLYIGSIQAKLQILKKIGK